MADANGQILVATPEIPPGDEKLRKILVPEELLTANRKLTTE